MREPIEALHCDHPSCSGLLQAPRSQLTDLAHEAGWQVDVVATDVHHGDGRTETRTDRCAEHHIVPAR